MFVHVKTKDVQRTRSTNLMLKASLPNTSAGIRATRVLTAEENAVANAYRNLVSLIADGTDMAQIQFLMDSGLVNTNLANIPAEFAAGVENTIAAATVSEAVREARSLPQEIVTRYDFEKLDPRAVAYARERAGTFVKQLSEEQRRIVHDSLVAGIEQQLTATQIAQSIRGQIGLHDRWAKAVESAHAVELKRLTDTGMALDKAEAKAQAFRERYHDRLLRARASNIARTEIQTAQNQGRFMSWLEAGQQKLIDPKTAKKQWLTGPSTSMAGKPTVCDICSALSNETVKVFEDFSVGVKMPPAHPNCRCTAVIVPISIEEIKELLSYTDQEYAAADEIRNRALEIEPAVTMQMQGLADVHGGRLDGLQHRLKERNSLARKIAGETRFAETPISTAQAAAEMRDVVRYTMVLEENQYAAETQKILNSLKRTNSEVRVKTRWTKPDTYHGVNIHVKTVNGDWFELQLHTEASLQKKNEVHRLYEMQRKLDPKSAEWRKLQLEMEDVIDGLKVPRGVKNIPGFGGGRVTLVDEPISSVTSAYRPAKFKVQTVEDAIPHAITESEKKGYGATVKSGERLVQDQGFDGLPQIVTKEQADTLIADGWQPIYRGLSHSGEKSLAQAFLEGDYFYGQGIYGNGTYTSTNIKTAIDYAGRRFGARPGSEVVQMLISPEAKFIEHSQLAIESNEMKMKLIDSISELNKERTAYWAAAEDASFTPQNLAINAEFDARQELLTRTYDVFMYNDSNAAMLLGYDGIMINLEGGEQYYIVLNRTSVAARDITSVLDNPKLKSLGEHFGADAAKVFKPS